MYELGCRPLSSASNYLFANFKITGRVGKIAKAFERMRSHFLGGVFIHLGCRSLGPGNGLNKRIVGFVNMMSILARISPRFIPVGSF